MEGVAGRVKLGGKLLEKFVTKWRDDSDLRRAPSIAGGGGRALIGWMDAGLVLVGSGCVSTTRRRRGRLRLAVLVVLPAFGGWQGSSCSWRVWLGAGRSEPVSRARRCVVPQFPLP